MFCFVLGGGHPISPPRPSNLNDGGGALGEPKVPQKNLYLYLYNIYINMSNSKLDTAINRYIDRLILLGRLTGEEKDQLFEDIRIAALKHERSMISWEEFLVATEMWHDDGIIITEMFDLPLKNVIDIKWPFSQEKSLEEVLADLLNMSIDDLPKEKQAYQKGETEQFVRYLNQKLERQRRQLQERQLREQQQRHQLDETQLRQYRQQRQKKQPHQHQQLQEKQQHQQRQASQQLQTHENLDEFEPTTDFFQNGKTHLIVKGMKNRQFKDECDQFTRGKPLSEQGSYSINYHTCKGGNCNYVSKVLPFDENMDQFCLEPTINEMNITQRLSDLGIGAHVETMCIRDGFGVIIKKYYDGTFTELIVNKHPNLLELVDVVEKLVRKMHSAGFVSRDIRPPNILYDKTPNGIKLVLNDFGLAICTKSKKLQDNDLLSVANIRSIVGKVLRGKIGVNDVNMINNTTGGTDPVFVNENKQPCDDWQ